MTYSFIGVTERKQLRVILDSKKKHFVRIGSEWHIIENQSNSLYRNKDDVWIIETLVEGKYRGRMFARDVLKALLHK